MCLYLYFIFVFVFDKIYLYLYLYTNLINNCICICIGFFKKNIFVFDPNPDDVNTSETFEEVMFDTITYRHPTLNVSRSTLVRDTDLLPLRTLHSMYRVHCTPLNVIHRTYNLAVHAYLSKTIAH